MRAPYPHILADPEACWCIPYVHEQEFNPLDALSDADLLDADMDLIVIGDLESHRHYFHIDNNMNRYRHGRPAVPYYLEYRGE